MHLLCINVSWNGDRNFVGGPKIEILLWSLLGVRSYPATAGLHPPPKCHPTICSVQLHVLGGDEPLSMATSPENQDAWKHYALDSKPRKPRTLSTSLQTVGSTKPME